MSPLKNQPVNALLGRGIIEKDSKHTNALFGWYAEFQYLKVGGKYRNIEL
jgi:hypothetical protein